MKSLKILVVAALSAFSTHAFAALITDPFVANGTTGVFMQAGDSIVHTHDISPPYVVGTPIIDASLTLFFRDDRDLAQEYAAVFGLNWLGDYFEVDTGPQSLDVGGLGLLQIYNLGSLTYALAATRGDFYFLGSKLEVQTRSVPEPGTLALLGAGLIGLALVRRRVRT